jgi:sugar lactone lactonase YvrE
MSPQFGDGEGHASFALYWAEALFYQAHSWLKDRYVENGSINPSLVIWYFGRVPPGRFGFVLMPQVRTSGRRRRTVFASALAKTAVLLAALHGGMQAAQAQVSFDGVQTVLGSGFNEPLGVAVDGSGNVYIADTDSGDVKEILAVNGSIPSNPTIKVLGSGFSGPEGVAVDGSGNVFVADLGNNAVKEIPSSCIGGVNNASCVVILGSGFNSPSGVAVDGSGNVFAADLGNNAVKEIPASCISGVNNASCVVTLGGGFNSPSGVAVDGSGDVFAADYGNNAVKEIPASCISGMNNASCAVTAGSGFTEPLGVAVDGRGNVFVADYGNNAVKELPASCISGVNNASCIATLNSGAGSPAGIAVDGQGDVYVAFTNNNILQLALGSVNLGAQPVGATSAAISLPFTVAAGTTVGSVSVLATGDANLDFAEAATSTCAPGTYAATTACTLDVTSTPHEPGVRKGAVEFLDGAGNVLALVYIYNTGTGPAVVFRPAAALTVLGNGFLEPAGVARDSNSDIFVADTFNNEVKEILAAGGLVNILGGGFNNPFGVAVDGAGNVIVADTDNNDVKEILAVNGSIPANPTINILGSGFLGPYGVTVDESGNVYVADTGNSLVKEILAVGGYTTVLTLGGGFNQPEGVAVDGSGNIFVADTYNNATKEILAAGGYTTVNTLGSGFSFPRAVALDASGNVYVADSGNNEIKQILAVGGYATVNILASGLSQPFGVTVGGGGDVYFSNSGINLVENMPRSKSPSFLFGSTNVFTTSSSSPLSATVQNVGNTPLTVTSLVFSDAVDFAQTAGSGTPEDCTGLTVLASGAECNLGASFAPQSVGALAGTITLTNNTLNAPGTTQSISLSGTGAALTQTIAFNAIPVQIVGASLNLTSFATASSGLAVNFLSTTPAICTISGATATMIAAGGCAIEASQGGNADYSAAAPVVQTVAVAQNSTTALAITGAGAPVTVVASGSVVTLTATVTVGAATVMAGTVNFCDATAVYCTDVHLLGSAQLTASGVAAISLVPGMGSHSYKAVFAGTLFSTASSSVASPLTVRGSFATTSTLSVTGNPGAYTFGATLVGTGSSLSPTGAIAFLDVTNGNSTLGSADLTTSTLTQTFAPQVSYGTELIPQSVTAGDFNRDGILDLAVTSSVGSTVSVLLGNPNGTFQGQVTYGVGNYPSSAAVGDFNGDGFPDLAVANLLDGTVSVLLGNGDGTFQPQVTYLTQGEPASIAVGDFNGDGFLDLVVASAGSSSVSVLLGTGDGTFNPQVLTATGSLLSAVAVGDFNGDGILDLAVTPTGGNSVEVLLGTGKGTFNPEVSYLTGNNPQSVAVGDFNGDGIRDLAVANHNDNTVSVLLGTGNGAFTTQTAYPSGVNPQAVAVGDFNDDGVPDLAVVNFGSTVSVLLGKGDGTFNAQTPYASGNAPYSAAVGDFNGDGIPDLAVLNQGSNSVSILLSQLTQTATASLANVSVQGTGVHNIAASYAGYANYSAVLSQTVPVVTVPYPQAAQPIFNPGAGTYSSAQTVAIADSTPGATIYYTTDGTIPTTASPIYTAPITVNATETLNAIAAAASFTTSPVATATITIIIPPSITIPPANQTIVSGQTAILAVVASGTAPLTYQWYQGMSPNTAAPVEGATAASLTTPSLTATTSYWVQVSNVSAMPAQSATAIVTVIAPPNIVSQPDIGVSGIDPGQTATITVKATGTPPLTYQWFQGMSPMATNPIAGAVNSSYTTPPLRVATNYWVQVGNPAGVVNSATLLVYVNRPPVCTLSVVGTSTPLAVNATASCNDPQNELLTSATINWGDGTTAPLSGNVLMHTYSAAGSYTVAVTATNTSGLTGSATQQVTPNQLPVCTLGIIQGTAATYAVSVPANCVDPQSLALRTTINWGDGTIALATNNSVNTHTYTASGTYVVTLTGTDTSGLTGVSAPQPVNVLAQAAPIAPGASAPVNGIGPPPPAAVIGTKVTFICSSVSTTLGGQLVNNALPSQYGISCSSPTITLTPAPTPINVTIQTTTSTTSAARYRPADADRIVCAVVFPLPGLALLLLGTISPSQRRRGRDSWLAIGFVAVLCFGLTSCGGSFIPPPIASTPMGQYYVTVVETVVNPPAPTGFVQTSLIVPLPVTNSAGN